MRIEKLTGFSIQILAECLNLAFADYVVPLYVSSAGLGRKMIRENIHLEWSLGLFDGKRLVGLILHGIGQKDGQNVLYNGGTGILPRYRGRGYVREMYQFLLPDIMEEGIQAVWLEVIDRNERAVNAYRKVGFAEVRQVDCFNTEVTQKTSPPQWPHIQIEEISEPNWQELATFFDYRPTWQNDLPALRNNLAHSTILTARQGQQYLGYLIYHTFNHRLDALAVHPFFRRRGIGTALLRQLPPGKWSVINIDRRNESLIPFLQHRGWEKTFGQLEMKWEPGEN